MTLNMEFEPEKEGRCMVLREGARRERVRWVLAVSREASESSRLWPGVEVDASGEADGA